MKQSGWPRTRSRVRAWCLVGLPLLAFVACSKLVFVPSAVVPTKHPLPYSARVMLDQVEAYTVKPGATMIADPVLSNYVTGFSDTVSSARADWEQAIIRYLEARRTFVRLTTGRSPADIDVVLHVNVYIDPSVHFQFKHIYVARVDATVQHPHTHVALLSYSGLGKAFGTLRREPGKDDQEPMNQAVQAGLNDLFGKMEQDAHLRRLGEGLRSR